MIATYLREQGYDVEVIDFWPAWTRIQLLKLYIDAEGDAQDTGNILDEETLAEMKKLQEVWKDVDPEEHSLIKKEMENKIKEDKRKVRLNNYR